MLIPEALEWSVGVLCAGRYRNAGAGFGWLLYFWCPANADEGGTVSYGVAERALDDTATTS